MVVFPLKAAKQKLPSINISIPVSFLPLVSSQKAPASPQRLQVRHAKTIPRYATLTRSDSRGCNHSVMFWLLYSIDPQIAPTDVVLPRGGRAVYTTHSSVGCLPRDVVSQCIRHEQLIRLDFHQLDISLVGCSDLLSGR